MTKPVTAIDPAALGLFAAACDATTTETEYRDAVAYGLTQSAVQALTEVCDISPTQALATLIVRATRELRAGDPTLGDLVAQAAVASAGETPSGDNPLLLHLVSHHEDALTRGAA